MAPSLQATKSGPSGKQIHARPRIVFGMTQIATSVHMTRSAHLQITLAIQICESSNRVVDSSSRRSNQSQRALKSPTTIQRSWAQTIRGRCLAIAAKCHAEKRSEVFTNCPPQFSSDISPSKQFQISFLRRADPRKHKERGICQHRRLFIHSPTLCLKHQPNQWMKLSLSAAAADSSFKVPKFMAASTASGITVRLAPN